MITMNIRGEIDLTFEVEDADKSSVKDYQDFIEHRRKVLEFDESHGYNVIKWEGDRVIFNSSHRASGCSFAVLAAVCAELFGQIIASRRKSENSSA